MIREMGSLLHRALGEMIDIRLDLKEDIWPCFVDAGLLESAILNLAINARDAMPAGGILTITASNETLDEQYAAENEEVKAGEYVCVQVADTGTGISPEVMDHIFEPFFTTKQHGKGSGLGLSMVYGFMKQSAGFIRLDSEMGRGTIMRLYLPRAGTPASAKSAGEKLDVPFGQGEFILLVEDSPALREATIATLKALKYRTIGVADAKAALNILDTTPEIRLLLSDIVLGSGMNGFELAHAARRKRPDLEILLISGFADPDLTVGMENEAKFSVLTKPFRKSELAAAVRKALAGTVV
jgi:CheY-like chemotaxis protein